MDVLQKARKLISSARYKEAMKKAAEFKGLYSTVRRSSGTP
jgi:hypothetical protein